MDPPFAPQAEQGPAPAGIKLGRTAIARLMRDRDFSLRTNRKRLAGTHEPERDRQFRYLTRMRRLYRTGDGR